MADQPGVIRFGVFEVHLATGEVRKNGSRVRLQEQPFQVLLALLERPGEVVTKEELKERLWAGDTFVDFDHSLSTAVNKIREALGDSASSPRFIETVPRRGYRFLAAAGQVDARPEPSRNLRPVYAGLGMLALLTLGGAWLLTSRDSATPTPVSWSTPRRITSDDGLTYQPAISPDGKLIAYASDRAGRGNLDIYVQQVPSGQPIRITSDPADDASPHFSPDGQSIAFHSLRDGGGVYVVSAIGGGTPRQVAAGGQYPRFSPDGRWIAFTPPLAGGSGGFHPEVAIVPTSGGEPRKLIPETRPVASWRHVWSPDSSAVLIMGSDNAFRAEGAEWRIVNLAGDDLGALGAVGLLSNAADTSSRLWFNPIQWNADGYVYFEAGHPTGVDVWRILADPRSGRVANDPEQVLGGPGLLREPSVSTDGRLVFASHSKNTDVWSLAVDTDRGIPTASKPQRVTTSQGKDSRPSVSLDGSRIAFESDRAGDPEVWTVDVSTGRERRLIAGSAPQLNDAGDRLALALAPSDNQRTSRLAILSIDGVVEKEFAFQDGFVGVWDWSSDERSILGGNGSTVFHLDTETGSQTELLAEDDPILYQANFSPDGRWITWLALRGTLWVAPFKGPQAIPRSEWVRIRDDSVTADKPRWSPNGNLLYYLSRRDGFLCIYAQPLDPQTKQPQGEPLSIYHSHDARLRIGNDNLGMLSISVARDKVVFCMTELTSNIWMMDPRESE